MWVAPPKKRFLGKKVETLGHEEKTGGEKGSSVESTSPQVTKFGKG